MPRPSRAEGPTATHELLDQRIAAVGLAESTHAYVVRCRRQGDSWRIMAAEVRAKTGRAVNHIWLYETFSQDPAVRAAQEAYETEQAARVIAHEAAS